MVAEPQVLTIFFKPENNLQSGSIEICDTGWGKGRTPTPEELEERLEVAETNIGLMKKDIDEIRKDVDDIFKFKIKMD